MDFLESFDQTEIIYQDLCNKIANPRNFFFTRTYMELRRITLAVSHKLESLLNEYINALVSDQEVSEFKDVFECTAGFYKNLKIKEYEQIPREKYERVSHLIATAARLGLMAHLFLVTTPTREEWYEKVDLEFVRQEWLDTLGSMKQIIRRYNTNIENIPGKLFDEYYLHYVKPVLENDFNLRSIIKLKQQQNYFKKIYFGGILLGLETDFAARMAKALAENNE
ncbi:MAG: hypothetical protein PHR65_07475 [Syntrophomonadaceae bacterium]|nr:hypothetical protein [Syntrophomonadaceae bacterium]